MYFVFSFHSRPFGEYLSWFLAYGMGAKSFGDCHDHSVSLSLFFSHSAPTLSLSMGDSKE